MEFPHLNDSEFPIIDNVDVYKYRNELDYSRFDHTQMKLTLCSVPWDMGEAHVGQRTITGIGNVVYFGSEQQRDAWFAAIPNTECFRFETKYRELHTTKEINVPVPFDIACQMNYLVVEYALLPSDSGTMLEYENDSGVRKWFWFVRDVQMLAPNTTKLELILDAWQTFIYRFDISEMILERGHAPLAAVDVDDYLADPIDNYDDLSCEDVTFGESSIVKSSHPFVFNDGTMYAIISTTANPQGDFGTKAAETWKVPSGIYNALGVPSVYHFALAVNDLNYFSLMITRNTPQFWQTVKGIWIADARLLDLGTSFTFGNRTCYMVGSGTLDADLHTLSKADFGYDQRYADLAKLYTFPYAHIEITDQDGNPIIVRIEDTDGSLRVSAKINMVFDFLNIDCTVKGIGSAAARNITFKNLDSKTFGIEGNWYDVVKHYKIPTYGIQLDAATEYDYSAYFDRKQAQLAAETAKTNAYNSAETAKDNATDRAETEKTIAYRNALTAKDDSSDRGWLNLQNAGDNADMQKADAEDRAYAEWDIAYNNANTMYSDASDNSTCMTDNAELQAGQYGYNNTMESIAEAKLRAANLLTYSYEGAKCAAGNAYANNCVNNEIQADLASTSVSNAQGTLGAITSGAAQGASAGVPGAVVGAIGGLVGGLVNAHYADQQTAIGVNLKQSQVTASNSFNTQMQNLADNYNGGLQAGGQTGLAISEKQNETAAANSLTTGTAANSAATLLGNAERDRDNEKDNSDETYHMLVDGYTTTGGHTYYGVAKRDYETALQVAQRTYDIEVQGSGISFEGIVNRDYANAIDNADDRYELEMGNGTDNDGIIQRDYDTAIANADNSYDLAIEAIENATKQAALREPFEYGEYANADTATTRPQMIVSNVVTQRDGDIAQAGDEFLRYGYMYNRRWDFNGDWCVMPKFTYWKLSDFWVKNLDIPDYYADSLRFFLMGGVTVWSDPSDIGNITIYENREGD